MKRRVALLAAVLLIAPGCASPTIGRWADRGREGIEVASANMQGMQADLARGLERRRESDVEAMFADIKAVRDGKIVDAQGKAKAMDDTWLRATQQALMLQVKLWDADRERLDLRMAVAQKNLTYIADCFDNIDKLRRAWGPTEELRVEVERLSAVVGDLVKQGKEK